MTRCRCVNRYPGDGEDLAPKFARSPFEWEGVDAGVLLCPRCPHDEHGEPVWLHHGRIQVFSPDSEVYGEPWGQHITIASEVTIARSNILNPSPRRDAVLIDFWCEKCDGTYALAIIQHKGKTVMIFPYDLPPIERHLPEALGLDQGEAN